MKKKMFIVDILLLAVCILLFWFFKLTGAIAICTTVVLATTLHIICKNRFTLQEFVKNEQKRKTIREEFSNLKETFSQFDVIINKLDNLVGKFETKQKALNRLIELNNGENGKYLIDKSQDAEDYLIELLKQIYKSLVVLQTLSKYDREYQNCKSEIDEIIKEIQKVITAYSELLSEVSRMGNNIEVNDPQLNRAVRNLKNLSSNKSSTTEQVSSDFSLFVENGEDS